MPIDIGRKTWAIPEGYIPVWDHGPEPEFTSHEAFCILNATDRDVRIELTVYYADRDPVGPYKSRGVKIRGRSMYRVAPRSSGGCFQKASGLR